MSSEIAGPPGGLKQPVPGYRLFGKAVQLRACVNVPLESKRFGVILIAYKTRYFPNDLKSCCAIRALQAFFVQVKAPASARRANEKTELVFDPIDIFHAVIDSQGNFQIQGTFAAIDRACAEKYASSQIDCAGSWPDE